MGVKIDLWFIIYEGRDTVIKNIKKTLKIEMVYLQSFIWIPLVRSKEQRKIWKVPTQIGKSFFKE